MPEENEASDRSSARETTLSAPASSATEAVRIGHYRLLQKIGEGGMGEVWLAEQTEPIRRRVAVKIVKRGLDTASVVARFEAERQALALMDHPGVATVFDAGSTPEGRPYFVMEYVHGEPINSYCDGRKLSVRERLELFRMVCDGVQHAHQRGLIHRDLKPSNVLVTVKDGKPQPKVIDFGLAKAMQQRLTDRTLFTELGVLVGTPEYMSPEQAGGAGLDIDVRTDVYSLGVMLYELLAGVLPFDPRELRGAGLDGIRRRIREEEPSRPSERISALDPGSLHVALQRGTSPARLAGILEGDLDWITMKAMEKDRARRYGSPLELAADIERHLCNEAVLARPPSVVYRTRKFLRRHALGTTVVASSVAGLLVFALAMGWQARRVAVERSRAEWVSRFLISLFLSSDPTEARGSEVTARELLDRGAARIEGELGADPLLQARVMSMLGRTYEGLGLTGKAGALIERALDIQRASLGPDHPDTLGTLHNLALLRFDLGRYAEAEALYREALQHELRSLGERDPLTLTTMANLANTLIALGRLDEAEPLVRRALEGRRAVRGPDHLETLASMADLSMLLNRRGRAAEAEPLLREAWERSRRVLGPDHPQTLSGSHNLAVLLNGMGRYADAELLYREALDGMRRVLGEDHLSTLSCEAALAMNTANLGRFDEAEALLRAALERERRVLGERHPVTLSSLYNLACIDALRGDRVRALEGLRLAVAAGYGDAVWMARDADLESLHGDPEFDAVLEEARRVARAAAE